ncbi:MAG: hypothetical protein DRI86_12030 [Bacteroidetes bacterium]|nr:MAG: hypothetical protein DRI86_12030 [Bacteroidota bacterium]
MESVEKGGTKDSKTNILALGKKTHQDKTYKLSNSILKYYTNNFGFNSEAQYFIADNYLNLNKQDSAIIVLNNLIVQDSTYAEAYNKLGEIYGRYKNNLQASEYYLIRGYEIAPSNASICENLGVLNGIRGNLKQSIFFFEKAVKNSDKPSKQLLQNLANTYKQLENNTKVD